MKKIVALMAVAAATASAFGQQPVPSFNGSTQFETQISTDLGLTWVNSASVSVNTAGANVRVLARTICRYVPDANNPDNYTFNKLNSSRHQPQATGLVVADAPIAGFNATGLRNPNFNNGFSAAADLGRVFGGGTVTAVVAHRPNASSLHYAEGAGSAAPGTGSNTTGSAGINCAQNLLSTPTITTVYTGTVLFYYGIDLVAPSVVNTARVVGFDVPAGGVRVDNDGPDAGIRGTAFGFDYDAFTDEDGDGEDDSSLTALYSQTMPLSASIASSIEISYVPAPGAAALLGLAGLVAGRRRR